MPTPYWYLRDGWFRGYGSIWHQRRRAKKHLKILRQNRQQSSRIKKKNRKSMNAIDKKRRRLFAKHRREEQRNHNGPRK